MRVRKKNTLISPPLLFSWYVCAVARAVCVRAKTAHFSLFTESNRTRLKRTEMCQAHKIHTHRDISNRGPHIKFIDFLCPLHPTTHTRLTGWHKVIFPCRTRPGGKQGPLKEKKKAPASLFGGPCKGLFQGHYYSRLCAMRHNCLSLATACMMLFKKVWNCILHGVRCLCCSSMRMLLQSNHVPIFEASISTFECFTCAV